MENVIIQIASTDEDLQEAKQLDDLAFGIYHGISMEELRGVMKFGKLILLKFKDTQELIGESQIIFEPIPELPYTFSHPIGFCYGTAIHPGFQGKGLGKILAEQQELHALAENKNELQMTVRVENYASLRLRMNRGFEVYAYQHDFYGSNVTSDARVFLRKSINGPAAEKEVDKNQTMFVPIDFNTPHDYKAHDNIQDLLIRGYRGFAVDRNGMYFV